MRTALILGLVLGFLALPGVALADEFELETVATGLDQPLDLTAPTGDDRLFVVEKTGTVRLIKKGTVLAKPFLTVPGVGSGSEQGLLSMAFHPGYASNGRFFVSYIDTAGDSRVAEFTVSADPDVADPVGTVILTVDQPRSNHNGGYLAFGPDGMLYLGLGDGGGAGDPWENAQNPSTLLGSILRIDVSSPGRYAVPLDNPFGSEVWAYGVRNPWRFSFDGGRLYLSDVGQDRYEEINVVSASAPGINYGWDVLEGSHCYEPSSGCSAAGTVLPAIEVAHPDGCSITGGHVYRGDRLPNLWGMYFYSDFCGGWLRSFSYTGKVVDARDWTSSVGTVSRPTAFGLDGHGELYMLTIGGVVYRLARSESAAEVHHLANVVEGEGVEPIVFYPANGTWWRRDPGASYLMADFSTASGWGSQLVGDFDGDGLDDIANYHSKSGRWWVSESTGSGFVTRLWADFSTASGWGSQLVGDFDGDGLDDIANYHSKSGRWWVSESTGSGFVTRLWADFSTASGWGSQLVGDFDGDGLDDIANYHSKSGRWWVSESTGSGFVTRLWADFSTASGWGSQLVGDFDGDGLDDIANYHSKSGRWWVSESTGSGFVTRLWADFSTASGWGSQLVGDFDGDGLDDIANYHSKSGRWWVSESTGSGFVTRLWADFSTASGWGSQLVGDIDGDGFDDIANYHSKSGTWWVSRSTSASFTTTRR